jgi:hypothetical protein
VVRIRGARWLWVLAAGLLAAACGSFTNLAYTNATFAYDNAAPMLTWVVDDYVDLSATQKEWVRQRLGHAMGWHRQRELPRYYAFFDRVLQQTEGPVPVAELERAHAELYARYHQVLERILPDAADLLAQLDAEQLQHLQDKLAENQRKFVKDFVDAKVEKRRRDQAGKWVDHLESWLGPLDDSQKDLVLTHVRGYADIAAERLADRRYREAEILRIARTRPPRDQAIAALRRLFIDTQTWRTPEYQQKLRERDHQVFEMLSALSATFTPEQRAHLAKRLRTYMRDIDDLRDAAAPGPTPGS